MTLTPIPFSGRNGFMIWDSTEIPIYSWQRSSARKRMQYVTSRSLGYNHRNGGTVDEEIIIRGVQQNVTQPEPFFFAAAKLGSINFDIGWNDLVAENRKIINVNALLSSLRVDFLYYATSEPAVMWTATFVGCLNRKQILVVPLNLNDRMACATQLCHRIITTTDTTLNSGFVRNVRQATLIEFINRQPYITSRTDHRLNSVGGTYDRTLEFHVQGDFDYWFDQVELDFPAHEYHLYYNQSNFWIASNMEVIGKSNLMMDIQTAQIVGATMLLGASYG